MLFRFLRNTRYNFCPKLYYTTPNKPPSDVRYRTGDTGFSTVLSGARFSKDDPIFHAIGATDELLSYLGLAREYAKEADHDYLDKLKRVQTVVIEISSAISRQKNESVVGVSYRHVKELEDWIAMYSKQLPQPEQYVIPGSGLPSSTLHITRTVCRRAERFITPIVQKGDLSIEALMYINRLSDFLFTISRIAAKIDKQSESIYMPPTNSSLQKQ